MQIIRKNYKFGYLCSDKDVSLYHWCSIKYSLSIFDVQAVITFLGDAVIPGFQMTRKHTKFPQKLRVSYPRVFLPLSVPLLSSDEGKGEQVAD